MARHDTEKPPFKKVLIINIFGIGDVLFTTPLIASLKAHDPSSYIGYICNMRTAPMLAGNKAINKIFVYEKDDFRDIFRRSKIEFVKKVCQSIKDIKDEQF